jgi:hypothetical protein
MIEHIIVAVLPKISYLATGITGITLCLLWRNLMERFEHSLLCWMKSLIQVRNAFPFLAAGRCSF